MNCERNADVPAMLSYNEDLKFWKPTSYKEMYNTALTLGKSLKLLGLNFKDSVSILSFNRPEWSLMFWGSLLSNCVPVGHYLSNNAQTCKDIVTDSKSRLIFVDSREQYEKIMSVKGQVSCLEYVVTLDKYEGVHYASESQLQHIMNQ